MAIRFRLGKADAEKYPGGDQWFTFDLDALMDMPSSEMEKLEAAMDGYSFGQLLAEYGRKTAKSVRTSFWIARRVAGVNEKFSHFDPRIWAADIESAEDERPEGSDPLESSPVQGSE